MTFQEGDLQASSSLKMPPGLTPVKKGGQQDGGGGGGRKLAWGLGVTRPQLILRRGPGACKPFHREGMTLGGASLTSLDTLQRNTSLFLNLFSQAPF